jgi:hypothetical protein
VSAFADWCLPVAAMPLVVGDSGSCVSDVVVGCLPCSVCVWMSVLVVASRSCRSTACGTGATVTQPMRRRRHACSPCRLWHRIGRAPRPPVAAVCDLGCFKPSTACSRVGSAQAAGTPMFLLLVPSPFTFCFSCFLLQIYHQILQGLTFHLCVFFSWELPRLDL